VNITGSYHRNIVGHAKASLEDRLDGADCDWVVETENSVKNRTHPQQLAHALITRLISVAAGYDVTWVCTQAVFRQRAAVTFEALRGDSNGGTAQVANAAASSLDEMIGRQSANGEVVGPNKRCPQPGDGAVKQNIGYVALLNPLEQIQAMNGLGRSDD
jgi:hypothetical protein